MKKSFSLLAVVFSITAFLSSLAVANLINPILVSNASAETFESEQGLVFTLNPTVAISISGGTGNGNDGLTINNLSPGDYKDSNIITVTASSNTPRGYTLASSVGSSTYAYTDLRKEVSDTTNKFTNLSGNKASLSNFDAGTWGYSYSTDSGSTWISGDITVTDPSSPLYPTAGYNGLPIYTSANPITLINSSSPNESSIQFKIGASANTSQLAGTYTNVINFIGVGKVVTTNYTINYNDPSGEATSGTIPSQQTGTDTTGNAAIQISSTIPVRTDYFFKGWCTAQTSDDTCSGDVIQPGGYLALNPGTSNPEPSVTKTIYAMWQSNSPEYSLTMTWTKNSSGILSDPQMIQIRTAENGGGDLVGTISSNGGSISGLSSGTTYYVSVAMRTDGASGSYGYVESWGTVDGVTLTPIDGHYTITGCGSGTCSAYQASFVGNQNNASIHFTTNSISAPCFPAGTQIATSLDGDTKPIEEIRAGDSVVSYDVKTDTLYMAEVTENIVHDGNKRATELVDLIFGNGDRLTMTLNHPILTTNGFKAVRRDGMPILTNQDVVKTIYGDTSIKFIRVYDVRPTVTYNLNVKDFDEAEDDDTYDNYVADGVIVHNAC